MGIGKLWKRGRNISEVKSEHAALDLIKLTCLPPPESSSSLVWSVVGLPAAYAGRISVNYIHVHWLDLEAKAEL